MNLYPLIFSNNNNYRITRHAIFWLMWITYYTIISTYGLEKNFPLLNRFFASLTEVALSTPLDMLFCYAIIYLLIPKLLFNGKYISMIFLWLLFSIIFFILFETYLSEAVPYIRRWFNLPKPKTPSNYYWIYFSLFSQINMEGCLAAAIKLGKISFIKQKEIDLLINEREKLMTKTNNTGMQPLFLTEIIDRVSLMAMQGPVNISDILKKIRNLIINILYQNTNAKVSLKKELELVKEYIELEQCSREEAIEVNLSMSGIESENIAPFVLLQCIQNAFNQVSALNIPDKKLDIIIKVVNRCLEVLISWNKPLYTSSYIEGKNITLLNLSRRLKLIYPESHEIKVIIEVEKVIFSLRIDLKGAIN